MICFGLGESKRLQASTGAANSAKTNFLWDPSFGIPQLVRETNGAGTNQRRYAYGHRRISMVSGSSNRTYYHYDGLGSAANLTAAGGATRWTYSYEPFGSIRTETPSGTPPANFHKFAGEYADPTGLYHLRARQYDSGTGRFLSRDPISPKFVEPHVSAYAYVRNQPTVMIDPSGHIDILPCSSIGECAREVSDAAQQLGRGIAAEPGKAALAGLAFVGAGVVAVGGTAATVGCSAAAAVDPLLAIHCVTIAGFTIASTATLLALGGYLTYEVYQAGATGSEVGRHDK